MSLVVLYLFKVLSDMSTQKLFIVAKYSTVRYELLGFCLGLIYDVLMLPLILIATNDFGVKKYQVYILATRTGFARKIFEFLDFIYCNMHE